MGDLNLFLILMMAFAMYWYFYIVGETVLVLMKQKFHRYFSPLIGYVIFSYIFFILFHVTTNFFAVFSAFLSLLLGCLLLQKTRGIQVSRPPWRALSLALGVAGYVIYILYPKFSEGGFFWSVPLFDHMKIAFTAQIAQTGIPVANPFCAFPEKTYYYFLYHVPLAVMKIVFGATSYEVELSGGMLSCLVGYQLMVGCICLLKGKECSWVEVVTCFVFSFMGRKIPGVFEGHGFDPILETVLWTPNTFLAAFCLIFSLFWIHRNKFSQAYIPALLISVILGLSPYIFLVAFGGLSLFCVYEFCLSKAKKIFFIQAVKLAALVFLFSLPILLIQWGITNTHEFLIKFSIFPWKNIANPIDKTIGFWTVFLLSEMPIIFLINLVCLKISDIKKWHILYFSVLASFGVSYCLRSMISNNDLGWRASFVGIALLTILAAYHVGNIKNWILKIIVITMSLYFISFPYLDEKHKYVIPLSNETISAIQRYVKQDDYFLNNITRDKMMRDDWEINSNHEFATITERRSCYMSFEGVRAHCTHDLRKLNKTVKRIFNGSVSLDDINAAKNIKCNKFIFHNSDPNWDKDELLTSFGLRKIYENNQIKIWE
ncbi:MAG: hypothetical protein IKS41_01435 [Alphaproteobacteria bacterium]|nr:hypothetical protein [Alphaproteobacteria bacterium]